MKRYNAYKPSGIEWIGDIPEKWETIKLKFLTSYNDDVLSEKTNDSHIINYVEISDVNCSDGVVNTTEYAFKDAPSRARRITKKNDVIISTVRTYLKSIAKINEDDLIVSTGFIVLRPKKIYNHFLSYSALSENFISDVISQSVGVSYPAIKASQIVNIKIPIPSYAEQVAIAAYLDAKCAKIDNVLSVQQKRIELLKELKQSIITNAVTKGLDKNVEFKPSGIEWIGDIPEKWKTMKLKHVLSDYQDGTHASYKRVLSDYPLLSAKNVFEEGIKITDEESTISESDFKSIVSNGFPKQGDIAICCVGTIGRCCLYTLSEPQAFQRSVTFLRTNRKILNNYLVYLMRSDIANPQYVMYAKTSAQSGIYMEALVNFKIVIPPKKEQMIIVSYLDKKCSAIDNQISKIERQIELLKEYKQSIITECVTGKRKVC